MNGIAETGGKLSGRVAVVTGGTRGIGYAISRALCVEGARVAIVYKSNSEAALKAEMELKREGFTPMLIKADVGFKDQANSVMQQVVNTWHRIDILVNNCGVFEFALIENMTEEFFDHVYSSNFKSALFCIQAALPWLKKSPCGRIVNASSISGHFADVGLSAYACSKASIDILTKIAASELAPYGITVNAYAPGIIDTDMTRPMITQRGELQKKQISLARFGKPEEVASLVVFLCSDEASYITGEIIGVDGGMLKVQNPWRAYRDE